MDLFYFKNSILLILTATAATGIKNEFVEYGFLGILLTILIWYSKRSYTDNIRRDKLAEQEKKELIERYEQEKKDIRQNCQARIQAIENHHIEEINKERQRYSELNLELMAFLRLKGGVLGE